MEKLIITNAGQALIAKLIAGTAEINFTKIKTSDYNYSANDIPTLTELSQIKQTANISSINIVDLTLVKVRASINNTGLEAGYAGYYVKAVGLYATDSSTNTEILFGVSLCGEVSDYLPAHTATSSGISYTFNCKVENTEQVNITVSQEAVASAEDVEELQDTVSTLGISIDGKASKVSSGTDGNLVSLTSTGDIADSGSKSSDFAPSSHTSDAVASDFGVHGFRFNNNKLQYYNSSNQWVDAVEDSKLYYYKVQLPATSSGITIIMHILSKINKSVMTSAMAVSGFISSFGDFTSGNFIVLPQLSDTMDMYASNPYLYIQTYSKFSFSYYNSKIRCSYRSQRASFPEQVVDNTITSDYSTYQIIDKQVLN